MNQRLHSSIGFQISRFFRMMVIFNTNQRTQTQLNKTLLMLKLILFLQKPSKRGNDCRCSISPYIHGSFDLLLPSLLKNIVISIAKLNRTKNLQSSGLSLTRAWMYLLLTIFVLECTDPSMGLLNTSPGRNSFCATILLQTFLKIL